MNKGYLLGVALWTIGAGSSSAQIALTCVPASGPTDAKDPIVSTEISVEKTKWSVTHVATSGARYQRAEQYDMSDATSGTTPAWEGVLKGRPYIVMKGELLLNGNHLNYKETLDNLKNGDTVTSISRCEPSSHDTTKATNPIGGTERVTKTITFDEALTAVELLQASFACPTHIDINNRLSIDNFVGSVKDYIINETLEYRTGGTVSKLSQRVSIDLRQLDLQGFLRLSTASVLYFKCQPGIQCINVTSGKDHAVGYRNYVLSVCDSETVDNIKVGTEILAKYIRNN